MEQPKKKRGDKKRVLLRGTPIRDEVRKEKTRVSGREGKKGLRTIKAKKKYRSLWGVLNCHDWPAVNEK